MNTTQRRLIDTILTLLTHTSVTKESRVNAIVPQGHRPPDPIAIDRSHYGYSKNINTIRKLLSQSLKHSETDTAVDVVTFMVDSNSFKLDESGMLIRYTIVSVLTDGTEVPVLEVTLEEHTGQGIKELDLKGVDHPYGFTVDQPPLLQAEQQHEVLLKNSISDKFAKHGYRAGDMFKYIESALTGRAPISMLLVPARPKPKPLSDIFTEDEIDHLIFMINDHVPYGL